jgi:cell wall assembly regulator SMI1
MKKAWDKFEIWLAANWSESLSHLNPPATDDEILELENVLNHKLPEDYKACLKIHNGQDEDFGGFFDNSEFLSTKAVIAQYSIWKQLLESGHFDDIKSSPETGIKDTWWNNLWIPFTHNGGGDHYCIDLDPTSNGQHGQIITMWHDMPEREIESISFSEWFSNYVNNVIAGKYIYSEDFGGLTDIDYA